jgi:hypothetical protein
MLERLRQEPTTPLLQAAEKEMREIAAAGLRSVEVEYDENTHNSLLIRARLMQQRVVSLAAMFWQTGENQYRDAAVNCVRAIGDWEFWSWIVMRDPARSSAAFYDLSYGENAATIAIAYDWLYDALTNTEREALVDLARRRALLPFLGSTELESPAGWFGRPDSNWNSVCCGGVGLLALAMEEDLPESDEVLSRVESSLKPLMKHLERTGGGWPEGLGYWNYAMRYGFMYLRSWENARGQTHPLLELPAAARTLRFPLDFTPHGLVCSFGDAGRSWLPLPFHYQMAEYFGDDNLLARLDAYWQGKKDFVGAWENTKWPVAANMLILHPRRAVPELPAQNSVVELYGDMGWGIMADQMPQPRFYAAVRGGSTDVPHTHCDQLSFHCTVDDEHMIENIGLVEYLDTTFSGRRRDVFEIGASSKNTLLINGVGVPDKACVPVSKLQYAGLPGIRMDATQAMGEVGKVMATLFCGRVFILLEDRGLLIIDRVEVPNPARIEARFFSPQEVTIDKCDLQEASAIISGSRKKLYASFASTKPALLQTAHMPLTSPQEPTRSMFRWATRDIARDGVNFATLLTPGHVTDRPAMVSLREIAKDAHHGLLIQASIGDWKNEITFNNRLLPT